jgi:hypothetical protein
MWLYLGIIVFLIFVIYKERQALGCPTIPDGSDCDNENGKAVKGTKPHPGDSTQDLLSKIRLASSFSDRWVIWRLSVLISVPCILFFYFFMYRRIPSEIELVLGMFVISSVVYFSLNFYKFHLMDYVEKNIDEGVSILSSRCNA